uniref:Ig-like domain-containing protein n=1 Tax=Pelusios castaneus TaxID=367368 RepID=A0A8C8S526_9SAUR
ILFYFFPGSFPAQFTVIGPRNPLTAVVGQDVVLSCHLSPRMSATNMEVRWFRSEPLSFVHLYHGGKDQYEGQIPEYRGRTELLKAELTDGNVDLRILNIRPSDEGQYHCLVEDGSFYDETILELRLRGKDLSTNWAPQMPCSNSRMWGYGGAAFLLVHCCLFLRDVAKIRCTFFFPETVIKMARGSYVFPSPGFSRS